MAAGIKTRHAPYSTLVRALGVTMCCAVSAWAIAFRSTAQTADGGGGPMQQAQFIGSAACAQCHAVEHKGWLDSHHAAAMQRATDATVLGRFDGATFTKNGVETTFFKKGGKFWVRTDGPDGKLADFEVKYTFGITPLQQYLIELSGGRLQAFGIAWDARPARERGQRWFHLYPDRQLVPGDPLHWTGIDQNWNYQCAWCHSTNLTKNYDRSMRTYKTEWSEISVGCEACHGPASTHVAWASKSKGWEQLGKQGKGFELRLDERRGVSWPMGQAGQSTRSQPLSTAKEVQVCASCHARRGQFSDAPFDVRRVFDAFRAARLEPGLYHADGQQRDEVYNYGSFLQSRMHTAGVICSDCHNPHSGKLRQTGNAVCSQCHASERFDVPAHHHHASGSTGAQCTSCHMPTTVYMGVDARHDHSMRIPRPDRTIALGTPNACNQCHADKPAQWARDAIKTWYPSPNPGAQAFAEAFDLGDRGAPGAQTALIRIVEDKALSGMVRASAITRLGRYPSRKVGSVIAQALKIDDPDIRSAAIMALSRAASADRAALLVSLLEDGTRLVRMDAAHGLAGDAEQALSPQNRKLFQRALDEYIAAQLFNAERAESHVNLGSLYLRRGMVAEARAAFEEALVLDPAFHPAAISLAELERAASDERAAEAILLRSLRGNTRSGPLLHALGLSLVRQKRYGDALERLAEAAMLVPEEPHFTYVHAVAMHGSGKAREAVDILKAALSRHPYDREILMALISYELEMKEFTSALQRAELMGQLEPERGDVQRLIDRLRRAAR